MTSSDPFSDFVDDEKTIIRPKPGGQGGPPSAPQPGNRADAEWSGSDFRPITGGKTNPFVAESFFILSLVPKLRNLPFYNDIEKLQGNLVKEIIQFENQAFQRGATQHHVAVAKLFVCSLIDETVLNTPWGNQSNWKHNNLSSHFFGNMRGGEKFFEELEQLKRRERQNVDLMELAYFCLSLGFQGKYRYAGSGLRELENIQQELYLIVQKIKGDPERELSVHWRGIKAVNPLIRYVPLWVVSVVAIAFLFLAYGGFLYAVTTSSDSVYDQLNAKAQKEERLPPIPDKKVSQALPPMPPEPQTIETPPPTPVQDRTEKYRKLLSKEIAGNLVEVIEGPIVRISDAFESGSDKIKTKYHVIIAKIAEELKNDASPVKIVGHTDSQKIRFSIQFPDNYSLSVARAAHVAEMFDAYPYLADRVSFTGKGYSEPIVKNDSKKNRALNRRIDIHIGEP